MERATGLLKSSFATWLLASGEDLGWARGL